MTLEVDKTIRLWSWLLTTVVSILTLVLAFAFAARGGPFVDRLAGEQGEVLVERAKALADGRETAAAMVAYRIAITKHFDSEQRRHWARRDFAALLHTAGQYEEAANVLRASVAAFPNDMHPWSALCGALAADGKYGDLVETAKRWYGVAERHGDTVNCATALYYEGFGLEKQGHTDDALAEYLAGLEFNPTGDNAYHAAVLLHGKGDDARAAQLLDAFIPHAQGWRLESATRLRTQIGTKSP